MAGTAIVQVSLTASYIAAGLSSQIAKSARKVMLHRGGRIRTDGLQYPKLARYQAALRPDAASVHPVVLLAQENS